MRWPFAFVALSMALSFACQASSPDAPSDLDAGTADNDASASTDAATPLVPLTFLPAKAFTGTDGTHTFKAPFAVYNGGDDLVVTVLDPSLVDIAPAALTDPKGDTGSYFMITAKAAGKTTLTATSHGRTASLSLTVANYEGTRYAVGEKRYTNDAGSDPPCTQCHGGAMGVDHSPATLSGIDDPSVATIITTGIVNGTPITEVNHAWMLSTADRDGLITYLRALPPKGF